MDEEIKEEAISTETINEEEGPKIEILLITDPIWLGSLYRPIEDYLEETGLNKYTNPTKMLSTIGKTMVFPNHGLLIVIAMENTNIVGFAIINVCNVPVPRIYMDALWQDKNYAKYQISHKIWNEIKMWAKKLQINDMFCLTEKQGLARGFGTYGWKAKGLLMHYDFSNDEE